MDREVARFIGSLSLVDIGRILFRRLMETDPHTAARMLQDTHPRGDSPSSGVGVFLPRVTTKA